MAAFPIVLAEIVTIVFPIRLGNHYVPENSLNSRGNF